ncbi:MAG: helix-turn-helix transcriptional regulator [Solirubrobacteraceae bacterium]
MPEIGETLREARMRERIDVSEIEAQTKIRAKYLRALENEEWDLLPGPTFVKSFLRTYATALGLDGKTLVEEYRLNFERPSEPPEPIVSSPRKVRVPRGSSTGAGPSRGYMALVGIVGVVIVLLIVGLISGGGKGGPTPSTSTRADTTAKHAAGHRSGAHRATGPSTGTASTVALSLRATGTVYVCLIGEAGKKLVSGKTLEAGARTPTFHAKRFELTLGNNAVALTIDGTPRAVPASSGAIGYAITKSGRRTLAQGHLPTCT